MKRSTKQRKREALTSEQVRARDIRKQTEADRAYFHLLGGEDAWQRELNRRRRARNERTREHTRQVVEAKRATQVQPALWDAA